MIKYIIYDRKTSCFQRYVATGKTLLNIIGRKWSNENTHICNEFRTSGIIKDNTFNKFISIIYICYYNINNKHVPYGVR